MSERMPENYHPTKNYPVQPAPLDRVAPRSTLKDDLELGAVFADSRFFKDSVDAAKCVVKIMAGREVGVGPFASIAGIYMVNGKPEMSANLQADLVKRSGKYDYRVRKHDANECAIEFFELIPGGTRDSLGVSTFTIADAKTADLLKNDTWKKYPRNMLFARAMTNGVAWYCPNVTSGVRFYDEGEVAREPIAAEARVIDPMVERAAELAAASPNRTVRASDLVGAAPSSGETRQPDADLLAAKMPAKPVVPFADLKLIPGKVCGACGGEVRLCPGGAVCANGHGSAEVDRPAPGVHLLDERQAPLVYCLICHGGEGDLPTSCPGRPLSNAESDAIYAGRIDFKGGEWVTPSPKPANGTAATHPAGGEATVPPESPASPPASPAHVLADDVLTAIGLLGDDGTATRELANRVHDELVAASGGIASTAWAHFTAAGIVKGKLPTGRQLRLLVQNLETVGIANPPGAAKRVRAPRAKKDAPAPTGDALVDAVNAEPLNTGKPKEAKT